MIIIIIITPRKMCAIIYYSDALKYILSSLDDLLVVYEVQGTAIGTDDKRTISTDGN